MSIDQYDQEPPGGSLPEAPGEAGFGGDERPLRRGLAWERREELGPGPAVLQTIREVVFSPAAAFRDMRVEGGWGEPLGFALLIGSIGVWLAQAWDMLTRSMLVGMSGFEAQEVAAANAQEIWFALLAPLLVCVSTFFGAALIHVLLLMFGGASHGYEATFRVVCYSWAVGVFNLVPICGVFVGAVWRIVVQIIGLREAQEVPGGRAAAAVLVPVLLACFCFLLLAILTVGLASLVQMGL